ncbi:MAG TPA: ABC transporter permease [Gemmatimonadales bacterium]|nr:ABC transporter permease [Gemmatimonadales bacterium]
MRFRKRSDQDFAEEIQAHLDLETDRLIAGGMSATDARAAAERAFGNRTAARERFHESRTWMPLEQLAQDCRYAVRSMRRTPGFAIIATLILAIGISVNTAAFSFINAFMFREFPGVVERDQLAGVLIGRDTRWGRSEASSASVADWELLQSGIPAFSGIAAYGMVQLSVRAGGEPMAVRGHLVSPGFFDVLGTRPAAGRFMTAGDDPRTLDQVVVISHRFWQRMLEGRPDVVGQILTIGTRSFTILGVAPTGFFGLYPGEIVDPDLGAPELWVPLAAARFLRAESALTGISQVLEDRWLQVFGRLAPGATLGQAEAQADAVADRLALAYPENRRNAFAVLAPGGGGTRNAAEALQGMLFVMVVPAVILLVACANLANQLLARAIERSREIAVRLSLGATRGRVVRQLLVETGLLAVTASLLGVLLARWLLDALRVWVLAIPFRIPIDVRVLSFTLSLALVTALVFGLTPALRATRTDLGRALKDGAPGSGYRRSRLRSALVVVQIAASLALLAVSSVFVRIADRPPSPSLDALADRALLVSVNLDLLGFDSTTGRAYQAAMLDRLGNLPGVVATGLAPFAMFDMIGEAPMTEAGRDPGEPRYLDLAEVSGAWFEATNLAPVRGRLFTAAEQVAPPSVAVVDEVTARKVWGGMDPIGRTLRIGEDSAPTIVTVVGIIPTRQEVAFREPEGLVVIPGTRRYDPRSYFYLRTAGAAQPMISAVRQAAREADPRVPIIWVRTLDAVGAQAVASLTMVASGLAGLGAMALGLAALGLFGVLSFLVAQRRYEIGIRAALGARRGDVTWMVLKQALRLAAGGVVVGALVTVAVVTLLRAIIHGLQPLDLPMFGGMAAIMVLVAALASAVPARRAASVDPMEALRAE